MYGALLRIDDIDARLSNKTPSINPKCECRRDRPLLITNGPRYFLSSEPQEHRHDGTAIVFLDVGLLDGIPDVRPLVLLRQFLNGSFVDSRVPPRWEDLCFLVARLRVHSLR